MGKKRKNPVIDAQILKVYGKKHSAYQVAADLGIGESTVYRVLLKNDVQRTGLEDYRYRITRFRGKELQIRNAYDRGLTMNQLRKRFGEGSAYAFKHAIARAGGALRLNPAPTIKPGELKRIKQMHDAGMGQVVISLKLGRSQSFVSRVMRENGITAHATVGESHPMWRGGRWKTGDGYIRVMVGKDHPMASMRDKSGYVLEHRLVMAQELGRPLLPTETVHHIDGNIENNNKGNLQLRQGRHGKHTVMYCLNCGSTNIGHRALAITED